ncbi:UDP-N-acetylglucosamine 2-epimerase [Rhodopirellula baltica]|uniref:UDP-N-acetyl-D-glucosamine 2-epimerase, UDP n=1 Tax=Rhodopirellula baltica WH47 TaxID=991778 RepID=F2ALQ5_RHOBT|nr:UDP-N-acetylglucosamine 2-epimerase [Rhodopirellula baltica]EGF29401.1 UDP-N-acetyl-D-glucosamine 2-epimerase, UDP [Rhodopirellula baltica WH47]
MVNRSISESGKRKICVVTGTRAEYGLLRYLMEEIDQSANLELQVIATGMHLSPEFGLTYRAIENDGFKIDRKVEMLLSSDSAVGIAKATGLGMIGFADALDQLRPDILVVLGDRFEILAAVTAALFAKIPVAHLHGGETTEGAYDEGIRHAITKMSHLHFVAAEDYRRRVLQLGENPENVHVVGGLGVDAIQRTALLTKPELAKTISLGERNLLVTYHPETLGESTSQVQMQMFLEALRQLDDDIHFLFTYPNADSDGRAIINMIDEFILEYPDRASAHQTLGQLRYWSAMKIADAVIGNSSSGLLEAPTLYTPTVDIGNRQRGRLRPKSVVHTDCNTQDIREAIQKAISEAFRETVLTSANPLGSGGATRKIVDCLAKQELKTELLQKRFYSI